MSAFAATRLQNKIIMLSDGHVNQNGETYSTDFRKVYKVDATTGFFWLGAYPRANSLEEMKRYLQAWSGAIEDGASDFLRMAYAGKDDILNGVDKKRFIVILLDGSKRYGFDSDWDDPFSPKPSAISTIGVGDSIYFDIEGNANGPKYQQKVQQKINTGMRPAQACKAGFSALMDELSGKGVKVGGEIFCESIKPKKKSVFRKALMN